MTNEADKTPESRNSSRDRTPRRPILHREIGVRATLHGTFPRKIHRRTATLGTKISHKDNAV
jgi:hypothetical protein